MGLEEVEELGVVVSEDEGVVGMFVVWDVRCESGRARGSWEICRRSLS